MKRDNNGINGWLSFSWPRDGKVRKTCPRFLARNSLAPSFTVSALSTVEGCLVFFPSLESRALPGLTPLHSLA